MRKTLGSLLALVLLAGCESASEPETPAASGPGVAPPNAVQGPEDRPKGYPGPIEESPAPKAEEPKPAPKDEAPKADAAKAEAPKADAPKDEAPKADAPKDEAPKTAQAVKLSADEVAAIEELADPADRKIALDQKVCPVGWEPGAEEGHLGSMGAPIKTTVQGKTVFVCCKGCISDLKADPDKYLAKINKK